MQAFLHHKYATELDKIIHSFNHTPHEEGSSMGRFHRIRMDIITVMSGNGDREILEECIRGQNATLKEYKDKLRIDRFPLMVKEISKKASC